MTIAPLHLWSQTTSPVLSLADSSVQLFLGGNLKTTALLSNRRIAPGSGTAYLLLPADVTGVEGTFDMNARPSLVYLTAKGPSIGSFRTGARIVLNFIRDLSDPAYGLLPTLLYVDLTNERWRFAVGQQMDVFSERIPNMIDGYFALAASGCAGNSSRGQVRATHFIPLGEKSKLSLTVAASQPVTTYYSKDLRNNSENRGIPNAEWAIKFESGKDEQSWVPFKALELAVSGVTGSYRVFKNDTIAGVIVNTRINQPHVMGICGEYAFRINRKLGIQGEVYAGRALGNYMGAILQTTKGVSDQEIRSNGFWTEAAIFWKKNWQTRVGYGQDVCNRDDLKGLGIQKNSTLYGNLIWDINNSFSSGIELTYKSTRYIGLSNNEGVTAMWMFQFSF